MVSVVVPVKDTPPPLLARAVESVVDQDDDGRVEVVLWDDGSTDRACIDTIDRLALRLPELVVAYRSRHNRGISAARNAACEAADGEWYVWLDSDDELPRGAIRSLLAATAAGARFAIGQCEVVYPDGRSEVHRNDEFLSAWRWSSRTEWDPLLRTVFAVHGGIVHRDVFWDVGGFDPEFASAELTDWFLRVLATLEPDDVAVVASPTYRYHKRAGSHSTKRELLEQYRRAALRRYADAISFRSSLEARYRDRCTTTGARRYELWDHDGLVVHAHTDAEALHPTELLPLVPSAPSAAARAPAHP